MKEGLVHIYCGDGKGKTTAAVGLATRACGYGLRVLFVQFLKSGNSAEIVSFEKLETACVQNGFAPVKFIWNMDEDERCKTARQCKSYFEKAVETAQDFDVLILDEVLDAVECKLLDEADLLAFLRERPRKLEVVMTGRRYSDALEASADYITCMQKIKHPFDKGVKARRGIEV